MVHSFLSGNKELIIYRKINPDVFLEKERINLPNASKSPDLSRFFTVYPKIIYIGTYNMTLLKPTEKPTFFVKK